MKIALRVLSASLVIALGSGLVWTSTLHANASPAIYVANPISTEPAIEQPSRMPEQDRAAVRQNRSDELAQASSKAAQPAQKAPSSGAPLTAKDFSASASSTAIESPTVTKPTDGPATPTRLRIPAISLDDPVVQVGTNDKGEMDVPSGKTKNVGWYKYGTVPGETGSAVMDAHVFAAFSNLKNVKVGDTLEVVMSDGKVLHFVVNETQTYPYTQVPAQRLFADKSGKYLNLITCAGNLVSDHSTYDHRLVVYATLAE